MKIKTKKYKYYIQWVGGKESWDLGDLKKKGPFMIRRAARCPR